MTDLAITYQPRAPHSLYAPCIMRDGEHAGEIEVFAETEPEPMTFGDLLRAIVNLVEQYIEGRKNDR